MIDVLQKWLQGSNFFLLEFVEVELGVLSTYMEDCNFKGILILEVEVFQNLGIKVFKFFLQCQ